MHDIRQQFPALVRSDAPVFLDNAGGSQMPGVVARAMYDYMTTSFVQTGADYSTSQRASAVVKGAHELLKAFVGTPRDATGLALGEAIIGPSTSQLCKMLAECYANVLKPGDEIVVCDSAHESNFGPWARLAAQGIVLRRWAIDRSIACEPGPRGGAGGTQRMNALRLLLSSKTRLVAFPQVSNILGEVVDVPRIVAMAHDVGARVVVDGVAYAPHRAIDAASWGVDWYVYSTYKVFGPHAAVLYGTRDAMAELDGPNHFFIPRGEVPRKFELGGANHESCAGILALREYFHAVVGRALPDRELTLAAFAKFEAIEDALQARFMEWLSQRDDLLVLGPGPHAPIRSRVCTISFVSTRGIASRDIAQACNARGIGLRYGNFYAYRLCESLGLDPVDGVVRVSFAHYNTIEEVDRLTRTLGEVIDNLQASPARAKVASLRMA